MTFSRIPALCLGMGIGMKEESKNNMAAEAFVIDSEHKILYFNRQMREKYPDIKKGVSCHSVMAGFDIPCEECPLRRESGSEFAWFDSSENKWYRIIIGEIEIDGMPCRICNRFPLTEEDKKLFLNVRGQFNTYDELIEIDFKHYTYKYIFMRSDKYGKRNTTGDVNAAYAEATGLVHPDDLEVYREFWDYDNFMMHYKKQGDNLLLRQTFRRKKIDGEYIYAKEILVPHRLENGEMIFYLYIQDITELRNRSTENTKGNDGQEIIIHPTTKLYIRSTFTNQCELFLSGAADGAEYSMVIVDIEHFKLFNDWYGYDTGNKLVVEIGSYLRTIKGTYGGITGYLGGDNFSILLPNADSALSAIQDKLTGIIQKYSVEGGFLPYFGVYNIEDKSERAEVMLDRAEIALESIKGSYINRIGYYKRQIISEMEEEQKLLAEVRKGFINHEFTYYVQPKCNLRTGEIVSGEALVRWIHPKRGLVSPGRFIPLLEKNGLIAYLDKMIWEQICKDMHDWIKDGHTPVEISVNVSRVDIYSIDVVSTFVELTERYEIPPGYLAIEITESAYIDDDKKVMQVVEQLHDAGFTVMMDDFGKGYSSLNMLKDIRVDVLKLDTMFLETNKENSQKGAGIVRSIIRLAEWLGVPVIAEGVETKEQVNCLIEQNCIYAQGYYFYRPMPLLDFLALISDPEKVDHRGVSKQPVEHINLERLRADEIINDTIVNNILGPVIFFDCFGERYRVYSTNQAFAELTANKGKKIERLAKDFLSYVNEEDKVKFKDTFAEAYDSPMSKVTGRFRFRCGDGSWKWLEANTVYCSEREGHRFFYSSVKDITEEKLQAEVLKLTQKTLTSIMNAPNNESFESMSENNRRFAATMYAQLMLGGMVGCYCDEEYSLYFASDELISLLGYESYEDFGEAIEYKMVNSVYPEDRKRILSQLGGSHYPGEEHTMVYRTLMKDGGYMWIVLRGKVSLDEDGRLVMICAFLDATELINAQKTIDNQEGDKALTSIQLDFFRETLQTGDYECLTGRDYELLYISDSYLRVLGYTRDEIKELYDNRYSKMIHPDDRAEVWAAVSGLKPDAADAVSEYRVMSKDGYIWVREHTRVLEQDGRPVFMCVVINQTEKMTLERELSRYNDVLAGKDRQNKELRKQLKEILFAYGINRWHWNISEDVMLITGECVPEFFRAHGIAEKDINTGETRVYFNKFRETAISNGWVTKEALNNISESRSERLKKMEFSLISSDNKAYWYKVWWVTMHDEDGNPKCADGFISDITEEMKGMPGIGAQMELDSLTNIYNRTTVMSRIAAAVENIKEEQAALIIVDIDDFKLANDTFGTDYGDAMMRTYADRLKKLFTDEDILGRVGGDRFIVLYRNVSYRDVELKLRKIIAEMKSTYSIGDSSVEFSVSCGYAMLPEEGNTTGLLYKKADLALAAAKAAGKRTFRKYEPSMLPANQ